MQADLLRVFLLFDFPHELGEEVQVSAMGGDHFHLAAPGEPRIGDGVHLARVLMEGEFIQHAVSALAGLRVRIG